MDRYDVIVIGAGVAGCSASIRAAQLGMRVACIQRASRPGSAGMWQAGIATRALSKASQVYEAARSGAHATLGVEGAPVLNLARMMAHKTAAVVAMARRMEVAFEKHNVTRLVGEARLAGPGRVVVSTAAGHERIFAARNIVIATGARPMRLPVVALDHRRIIDCSDALALARVPDRLAIAGAGAAGLEIGSIWRRLGSDVTLVAAQERIGDGLDHEIADALRAALERQGLVFHLASDVVGAQMLGEEVRLTLQSIDGAIRSRDVDMLVVAIGREPALDGLNLASVGLRHNAGKPLPNQGGRTKAPGVWVIGDAAAGPGLAHRGAEEGIACVEQIAGLPGHVDYGAIPRLLQTRPEVATLGRTEEELVASGVTYKIGRASLASDGTAMSGGDAEGFVKLLVDARTHLILGAHLIGPGAGDMIAELGLAMETSAICEDIARTSHPQQTRSQAVRQAAMDAGGWRMLE